MATAAGFGSLRHSSFSAVDVARVLRGVRMFSSTTCTQLTLRSPKDRTYHRTQAVFGSDPVQISSGGIINASIRKPDKPIGSNNSNSNSQVSNELPPIIIIPGTTQTLSSFQGHARTFARHGRTAIVYEARGQGLVTKLEGGYSSDLCIHASDLNNLMDELNIDEADLCGFSFGGRVALATANMYPNRVRKVVTTGVGASRDAQSKLLLQSWKSALDAGCLEPMVWSSLLSSHSASFMGKHQRHIPLWVKDACRMNHAKGVLSIVEQILKHGDSGDDDGSHCGFAKDIQSPVLCIGGSRDILVSAESVEALALNNDFESLILDAAHAVPTECPALWNKHVRSWLHEG